MLNDDVTNDAVTNSDVNNDVTSNIDGIDNSLSTYDLSEKVLKLNDDTEKVHKIHGVTEKDARCLQISNLFGNLPLSIESFFVDGVPDGLALLNWPNFKAEIYLKNGFLQNHYKLIHQKDWSVGTIKDGTVNGPCVMVKEDMVWRKFAFLIWPFE